MKITFYGHSCFGIEVGGKHLLFDPFITPNEQAKSIDVMDIKADYILLSHGHVDHVADAEAIAKHTKAQLISNYEIVSWYGNKGVTNGHPLNHGGKMKLPFGTVKYVNAVHSSVLPDGAYGGNPGGFVVESDEGNFYYAGDTALHMDMQLIGRQSKIDFALLPIGDNFTMGIEDAVVAAEFVRTKRVIGMHYDTFDPIKIDHEAAEAAFKKDGCTLTLMSIGETIEMNND